MQLLNSHFLLWDALRENFIRQNGWWKKGRWPSWHPYEPFLGDEVTGRTVAVIGTGRIGKSFIKKAVGFDMDVLCYDSGLSRS